ncbi:sigma factor [Streptomyces sp. WMMC1477]|uniref:sigma factor n=1 Tax=Streptomyces sp. WMMC1477 TaxID=3015155 RepID=UPI0022B69787|nr:sigma factor [Streptomyces sp. WMMC1477]MCZ7430129.1 sigma factor [Streptomyces sp. WMMC1477]
MNATQFPATDHLLNRLVRRHHSTLLAFITRYERDPHQVEDLAQDAWLRVITRADSGVPQADSVDPESGLPDCLAFAVREVLGLQETAAPTDANELLAEVLAAHRVVDGPVPEQLLPAAA